MSLNPTGLRSQVDKSGEPSFTGRKTSMTPSCVFFCPEVDI